MWADNGAILQRKTYCFNCCAHSMKNIIAKFKTYLLGSGSVALLSKHTTEKIRI